MVNWMSRLLVSWKGSSPNSGLGLDLYLFVKLIDPVLNHWHQNRATKRTKCLWITQDVQDFGSVLGNQCSKSWPDSFPSCWLTLFFLPNVFALISLDCTSASTCTSNYIYICIHSYLFYFLYLLSSFFYFYFYLYLYFFLMFPLILFLRMLKQILWASLSCRQLYLKFCYMSSGSWCLYFCRKNISYCTIGEDQCKQCCSSCHHNLDARVENVNIFLYIKLDLKCHSTFELRVTNNRGVLKNCWKNAWHISHHSRKWILAQHKKQKPNNCFFALRLPRIARILTVQVKSDEITPRRYKGYYRWRQWEGKILVQTCLASM